MPEIKPSGSVGAACASAFLWALVMGGSRALPPWWGALFGAATAAFYLRSYLRRHDVTERAAQRFVPPPARAWGPCMLAALAIASFNAALVVLWGGWPVQAGVDADGPPRYATQAIVFVPFIEELAFRGRLLRVLEERLAPFRAWLVCAVIFAAFHLSPQSPTWGLLPALVIGCLFGAAVRLTGSVFIAMALHAVGNGTVMGLDLFEAALPPALPAAQMKLVAVTGLLVAAALAATALWLWSRQNRARVPASSGIASPALAI